MAEEHIDKLPTMYEYVVQVYEAMREEASIDTLGSAYGDEEGLVYDGFTTKLIEGLGLPVPYYSKTLKHLQRMDCIRQLRRGGSTTTSRWLLLREPTPELFMTMQPSRAPSAKESLQQQVSDLNTRMGRIEDALGIS